MNNWAAGLRSTPTGEPTSKRLLVNGDDFGLTAGVNVGIIRAFREGILRSTSLMATGAAFADAVRLARTHPELDIGCHLVFVDGMAAAAPRQIPSLATSEGRLPRSVGALLAGLSFGRIRKTDLATEAAAQIERLLQAGVRPSHLDTHKHTHLHPRILEIVATVAERYGIRWIRRPYESLAELFGLGHRDRLPGGRRAVSGAVARLGCTWFERALRRHGLKAPDRLAGFRLTGALTPARLQRIIEQARGGLTELVCHPGICDAELQALPTRLKQQRQIELDALCAPGVKEAIARSGVRLCNFRELDGHDEHLLA